MTHKKIKFIKAAWLTIAALSPAMVSAANSALDKLSDVGAKNGPYQQTGSVGIGTVAGVVVSAVLSLIGVIFLALMIYAGYHWMTARGEEEKVEKAKDTITRAIIGLIIVVGAYAIWSFIFSNLIMK